MQAALLVNIPAAYARIAARIAPFYPGVITTPGVATRDTGGSIATAADDTERACRIQVDVATDAMRRADDFTEKDVRLLVLGLTGEIGPDDSATVTAGATVPAGHAGTYSIQSVARDPAGIGWELRGRLI